MVEGTNDVVHVGFELGTKNCPLDGIRVNGYCVGHSVGFVLGFNV